MKRILAAAVAAAVVGGAGVARAVIDPLDFAGAIDALTAVDPQLALEAQTNSSSERDFAVGGGQSTQSGSNFGLSAHSGPAGEDAFGHVSETIPGDGKYRARVVCLAVVTNPVTGVKQAGTIGEVTESSSNTLPPGMLVFWFVQDTGLPGGDGDGFRRTTISRPPNPLVCPPRASFPLEHGNINIHDA